MKAIQLTEAGAPDRLQLIETGKRTPAAGEVLVKTKAISINPVDSKTRQGKSFYTKFREEHETIILGWDISGTVESVGANVTELKPGDEVFGMVNFPGYGKAYAEYVAAPASHLAKKPENVSHNAAAAATLAALTAYQVLHRHVRQGDKVLVQAASGGVGHFAVQIAKILGAEVTAITSTKNIEFVKSLGADHVIDYTVQPFEDVAKDFDFVLDTMSGDILERAIQTVKKGGTIITLPSAGFNEQIVEKGKAAGITIDFEMVESSGADMKQIADWLASGQLRAEVAQTFPFEKMADAHAALDTARTRGKIIVTL